VLTPGGFRVATSRPIVALPERRVVPPAVAARYTPTPMQPRKLLARVSRGDLQNVSFGDFCRLLEALGFSNVRTSGSHRIYAHLAMSELVNVQDVGGEAKPYQIRQVLRLVERYNLKLGDAP
jgi:predicted RNA binding protein YcfA (HicA-like mRNA interferase family)